MTKIKFLLVQCMIRTPSMICSGIRIVPSLIQLSKKRWVQGPRSVSLGVLIFAMLFSTSAVYGQQQELAESGLKPQHFLTMLRNREFLDDLEAIPSQREAIQKLYGDLKTEFKNNATNSQLSPTERSNYIELGVTRGLEKVWSEILLPHQRKRFVQLIHQKELQRYAGNLAKYMSEKADTYLDLTADQKRKLEEIQKANEELLKKEAEAFRIRVAEIIAKGKKDAIDVLDDEQKSLISKRIGDRVYNLKEGSEAVTILNQILREK